jgi:hypothetical protein
MNDRVTAGQRRRDLTWILQIDKINIVAAAVDGHDVMADRPQLSDHRRPELAGRASHPDPHAGDRTAGL